MCQGNRSIISHGIMEDIRVAELNTVIKEWDIIVNIRT